MWENAYGIGLRVRWVISPLMSAPALTFQARAGFKHLCWDKPISHSNQCHMPRSNTVSCLYLNDQLIDTFTCEVIVALNDQLIITFTCEVIVALNDQLIDLVLYIVWDIGSLPVWHEWYVLLLRLGYTTEVQQRPMVPPDRWLEIPPLVIVITSLLQLSGLLNVTEKSFLVFLSNNLKNKIHVQNWPAFEIPTSMEQSWPKHYHFPYRCVHGKLTRLTGISGNILLSSY